MKKRNGISLTIWLVILIGTLSISFSGCNNFLGSSDTMEPIDWQNGEIIVAADESGYSEEDIAAFTEGAEKQAIRYVEIEDSVQTEIPDKLVDLLYNGMIHIANSDHSKAKEVIHEYEIRVRKPSASREIEVDVDGSASWVEAWEEENTETGTEAVDSLLTKYDMSLADFREQESGDFLATLQTGQAFNVYAIGREFEGVEDINSAGPAETTAGNEVGFMLFEDHVRYVFQYGFGGCEEECADNHLWHFNVYLDGTVEYLGEEGDPLPKD